ncbi:hypothetical protein [Paraburkholderia caballeronis]|uniref:hypothetical protein n=1 Tax=Paraburkholderia caballeronis TaxID=416943 RepID=UPI00106526AB|nr:hypothetical protein [Paraburkholderia caballeronis]
MSIIRSMACPNWMILLSFPRLSDGKSLDFGRRFVSSLSGEANDGEPVRAQWKILAGLTPTKEKQDGGEAGAVTHDGDDSTKESGAVSFLSCPAGPSRGIDGCLGYALVVRGGRGSGPGGASCSDRGRAERTTGALRAPVVSRLNRIAGRGGPVVICR